MNIPRTNCLLLMICALASNAFGQVMVVDQQFEPASPELFDNVTAWSPIGQGFTPTFNSLSFVNLYLQVPLEAGTAVLSVEINSQTIDGPVLGVSAPETLASGMFGATTFTFASPVALDPGSQYFIQLVQDSGNELVGIVQLGDAPFPSPYPGGPWIIQGSPESNADMWFSEGIIVPAPEPTATVLIFAGATLFLRRRKMG